MTRLYILVVCGTWLCIVFVFAFIFATYLAVGAPLGQLPLKIFWIWDFCFHLNEDTCNMLKKGTTFYILIKLWQNKVQDIFATKIEMLILLLRFFGKKFKIQLSTGCS